MRVMLFTTAAALCLAATTAPVATPAGATEPPAPDTAAKTTAAKTTAAATKEAREGELTADMEAELRKAGFSDLQIMPNSVFVRGKDRAGHPVAMVLNPGTMTEVVTLDPHAGTAAGGNGALLTGSGTFATVLPTATLASALIGAPVVDAGGAKVGTIKDLAIDHGGVHAFIVGVGGVFGLGDRYLAVTPGALDLTFDKGKARATLAATVDQLKAAPEFKFEDVAKR